MSGKMEWPKTFGIFMGLAYVGGSIQTKNDHARTIARMEQKEKERNQKAEAEFQKTIREVRKGLEKEMK